MDKSAWLTSRFLRLVDHAPYAVTLAKSPVPHIGYVAKMPRVETIKGIPLWKPPYGRITAIDLNTGDHRWMAPLGDLPKENSVLRRLGLSSFGRAARGHLLLTKTLLIVGQEGNTQREESIQRESGSQRGAMAGTNFEVHDPKLVAYDKATGKLVGEMTLPRNVTGDTFSTAVVSSTLKPSKKRISTTRTLRGSSRASASMASSSVITSVAASSPTMAALSSETWATPCPRCANVQLRGRAYATIPVGPAAAGRLASAPAPSTAPPPAADAVTRRYCRPPSSNMEGDPLVVPPN
jgi:hypothetical protein